MCEYTAKTFYRRHFFNPFNSLDTRFGCCCRNQVKTHSSSTLTSALVSIFRTERRRVRVVRSHASPRFLQISHIILISLARSLFLFLPLCLSLSLSLLVFGISAVCIYLNMSRDKIALLSGLWEMCTHTHTHTHKPPSAALF